MELTNDVEGLVSSFFKTIGFKRVSEFVGDSPNFYNADFINTSINTVVELKVINKDYFEQGGIIDRFHGFIPHPINVDAQGLGLYSIKFPSKNREGGVDSFEEPLRRILKKANRQIKETKAAFKIEKGYGFVFIILDGFRSLNITIVNSLIIELLKTEFKSISGHIIFTERPEILHPTNEEKVAGLFCEVTKYCDDQGDIIWQSIANSWINLLNNIHN